MTISFRYFKKYEIVEDVIPGFCTTRFYDVKWIDSDTISHSAKYVIECDAVLIKHFNKAIPDVVEYWVDSVDYKFDLIEPSEMAYMCRRVLDEHLCDDYLRDRFELYLEKSLKGYYICYEH